MENNGHSEPVSKMSANISALFIHLLKQRNTSGIDEADSEFPDMSLEDLLATRSKKLVTTEEAVIVIIVLVIWVAVILLFVRKWGKIRGLEPYTPTFDRNASFSIPPPAPLSSMKKKTYSESRDTLNSIGGQQRRQLSDSQGDRLMLTMPGSGRQRRTSASSPDIRFTHSKRTFPPLPRLQERYSEDSDMIEQETVTQNAV